jgi:hypothetical protein
MVRGSNSGAGDILRAGPEVHPASRTMGTGSFPVLNRPERGADHPPPSSANVANGFDLYLPLPSVPA